MNREIKFRRWNGVEMYYPHLNKYDEYELADLNEPKIGPWMQYTGLKDRNGKEIYEGDIVSFKAYGTTQKEKVEWGPTWKEDQMGGVCCGAGFEVADLSTADECEVIGNIYENPELLDP